MRVKKSFKTRRKKSFFKLYLFCFFILAAFSGLIYFLFFSSFFTIKEINILNNKEVPKQQIENAISLKLTQNIFLADTEKSCEEIKDKILKISEVSIKKSYPNKIMVQVEERKPVAILQKEDSFYFIDKKGIAYQETNRGDSPVLISNGIKITPDLAQKSGKIMDKFQNLDTLTFISEYRANAKSKEGWEAYINLDGDVDWQMEELQTILNGEVNSKDLKYIDLRFDKIYIFPETAILKNPTKK